MKAAHYKCSLNDTDVSGVKIAEIKNIKAKDTYDCEVLVWNNKEAFHEEYFKRFPDLKMFVLWGTDDDLIDKSLFAKNNVIVKKNNFYATEALAEYILSLILLFERQHMQLLREKVIGGEIYRKKVGIIGMGKIGARTAAALRHAFHCEVKYYSRVDKKLDWCQYTTVEDIFAECDYVIITSKSAGYTIDIRKMSRMNPNLVVVNIARDSILPVASLVPLLKDQKIRGFVGDIDPPSGVSHHTLPPSQFLLSPHRGYLTQNAIDMKKYILTFYIAKMQHKDWQAYVIRHGETEWNSKGILQGRKNSPLSQKGRGHAKKMADHLKKSGIKRIYVSPLGRAQETAAVIAKKIGASVIVVPEFAEMHFGAFEGKDKRQIEDLFADFFEQRKKSTSHKLLVPYPAGESYYDVYLRVLQPLLRIIAKAEPFIIVGHESVNRMLKGIMLEQELEQMVGSRQKNNEIIKVNITQSSEQVTTL